MAMRWGRGRRVTAIIGLPGDRSDTLLEESARVAACGFNRITIREDADLRGRKPGELPKFLKRVIEESHPDKEVKIIPDELEAVAEALNEMEPGEVLVAFCERPLEVRRFLESRGAVPVNAIPRHREPVPA